MVRAERNQGSGFERVFRVHRPTEQEALDFGAADLPDEGQVLEGLGFSKADFDKPAERRAMLEELTLAGPA